MTKPDRLLTVEEQIAYLKAKGLGFSLMGEDAARDYLTYHNNYFKLTAYRKNFQRHPGGSKQGQYVRLEFAYLVDLAEIDMELRYLILQMELDIEHHVKLQILRTLEASGEDGYTVVDEYWQSLSDKDQRILADELRRSQKNVYCGDLAAKYQTRMPVWVFLELVSFGKILSYYRFLLEKSQVDLQNSLFYCLLDCKSLRNAAAHSSCILNDLASGTSRRLDKGLQKEIARLHLIPKALRNHRLGCERIRQLATFLYTYRKVVVSPSLCMREEKQLHSWVQRIQSNKKYYEDNDQLRTSFVFLENLIDSWYSA